MTARTSIQHNSGRKPALPRQRPRKAEKPEHVDKYAEVRMTGKLAELAVHFNGEEGDRV